MKTYQLAILVALLSGIFSMSWQEWRQPKQGWQVCLPYTSANTGRHLMICKEMTQDEVNEIPVKVPKAKSDRHKPKKGEEYKT